VALTNARYQDPARQIAFFENVLDKLRGLPGVEAATVSSSAPFNAGKLTFSIQGQPVLPAAQRTKARYFAVGSDYFRVLNVPLIQGRAFRQSDRARAPRVAIVNRAFAERFFAGRNPIGRFISIDHGEPAKLEWSEIVGIARNIKVFYGPKEEDAQMYDSYLQ